MEISKPLLISWNLTNKCNLHCSYCYQNAGKKKEDELSLTKKLDLIDQFSDAGVFAILFGGGEPLLCDDLFRVAKYANSKDIICGLLTNGTLLTKDTTRKLRDYNFKKIIINTSAERITHEDYRGKGSWEKTLDGILNSRKEGLEVKTTMTLTKKNFSGAEKYIQLMKYFDVHEIGFGMLIPTGRGKNMTNECLSLEQVKNLYRIIARYISNTSIRTSTCPYTVCVLKKDFMESGEEESLKYLPRNDFGCTVGISDCTIQPNGLVTPCLFMPNLIVGNIKKNSFTDIWKNSPLFKKLRNRDNLEGYCGSCDNKYACGGCRARAYAATGNIFAEDPLCVLKK